MLTIQDLEISVADPDPLVRGMDPDPALDLDPDPSIIKQKSVLRIHGILVWIRIHGSMPLTNESGFRSGPCTRILLFSLSTFKMPAKKQIL